MNQVVFGNGSKEIKTEKVEDLEVNLETLHHCVDIKEETSTTESQLGEDSETPICNQFDSGLKMDKPRIMEIDNLVINRTGEKSSLMCGFEVAEFLEPQLQGTSATSANYFKSSRSYRRRMLSSGGKPSQISAKKEKFRLQVEYLKLKNYLTKLENLKLERELKLHKS